MRKNIPQDNSRSITLSGWQEILQKMPSVTYFIAKSIFCQYCGMQLRTTPAERECKEKVRAKKTFGYLKLIKKEYLDFDTLP
jgi:hypothetical protein